MDTLLSRAELEFQLFEHHCVHQLQAFPRYADHDLGVCESILDIAYQIAAEQFLPHAASLDANEPHFDGSKVHIIPQVAQALAAYREAGFFGASFAVEEGGLQLPWTMSQAAVSVFASANIGTLGYAVLTVAAANMLKTFGSRQQIDRFLPAMVEGRWFGTMCLSEPHAGSSLSDIRCKAIPNKDGTYQIQGTKMWISAGDHDLSENIIHMVLARLPDSPAGVAGISLFLVPKRAVCEHGKLGSLNGVRLAGLNHKMGWRGTVNTVLNFGDENDCSGFLIGEPNRGLSYMFHMLNEARIAVGLEATALAGAGYTVSLEYAKSRAQGRHPDEKDPASPAVPIIEHADIRRLLLQQRAYIEGALSLLLYCAKLIDLQRVETGKAQQELSLLLDLLTPIAKGWPSEFCPVANKNAIQILGGYGYTRDYPVERLYRDNRLNAIHDGTTAMQAIDLLGRKIQMAQGGAFTLLIQRMSATIDEALAYACLREFSLQLAEAKHQLEKTTQIMKTAGEQYSTRLYLANATLYLESVGHVVIAWMWLQQGIIATQLEQKGGRNTPDFYRGKMLALKYFFRYELPSVKAKFELLQQMDDTCLGEDSAVF